MTGANRPNLVSGLYQGAGTNYASGVSYLPHGGLQGFTMGNTVVPWFGYNARLPYVRNSPLNATDPSGAKALPGFSREVDMGLYLSGAMFDGGWGEYTLDGVDASYAMVSGSLSSGAAATVLCPDGYCGPRQDPKTGQTMFLGAFADGSAGYVPGALAGMSPSDISSALSLIKAASPQAANPINPSQLTGDAGKLYKTIIGSGVSPGDISVYSDQNDHLSVVLSAQAIGIVQQNLPNGWADTLTTSIFHPGYTDAGRDTQPYDSVHGVWIDPRLSAYYGIGGVYAQFHFDAANPYGGFGPFFQHQACALLNIACGGQP